MAHGAGPLEALVQRLNGLQARGLIGEHAIGGAMAFIYWAEPFETKDVDVFAFLPTTATGLIDLTAVRDDLVSHGGMPEGQFIRVGRLLLDFVPPSDALDEAAVAEAVPVQVGAETTRVFTPEHAVAIALRTWRGKGPRAHRSAHPHGSPAARHAPPAGHPAAVRARRTMAAFPGDVRCRSGMRP